MTLEKKGTQTKRGDKPQWLRLHVVHHMIASKTLKDLWNSLVGLGLNEHQARYLELIGFGRKNDIEGTLAELEKGGVEKLRGSTRETLDSALTYQDFNLFFGPIPHLRPQHSPDPSGPREIGKFFSSHGVTYDWPIVGPPHGLRVQQLYRASEEYKAFAEAAQKGSPSRKDKNLLYEMMEQVAKFSHLGVIKEYEVNWHALPHAEWVSMSPQQKMTVHDHPEGHLRDDETQPDRDDRESQTS
jgi:hypothetical protein